MTRCVGNIAGILSEMHINVRICFKDYLFETEVLWVVKSWFFVTYSHVQCLASAFPLYFLRKTRYLSTCTFLTKYKGNTLAKHWTWLYVTKYQGLATHNTSVSNKFNRMGNIDWSTHPNQHCTTVFGHKMMQTYSRPQINIANMSNRCPEWYFMDRITGNRYHHIF